MLLSNGHCQIGDAGGDTLNVRERFSGASVVAFQSVNARPECGIQGADQKHEVSDLKKGGIEGSNQRLVRRKRARHKFEHDRRENKVEAGRKETDSLGPGERSTIPAPEWVKQSVEKWALRAGINAAPLLRSIGI